MPRPTEITLDRVCEAADALEAKHEGATVAALRAVRGVSDNTISKYLRVWRVQRASGGHQHQGTAPTFEVIATLQGWATGLLAVTQRAHEVALQDEADQRRAADQLAADRLASLLVTQARLAEREIALRQRSDQLIAAQEGQRDLMGQLARTEEKRAAETARAERAHGRISMAEQRAALAQQRAEMIETMRQPWRARGVGCESGAAKLSNVTPPGAAITNATGA